MHPTSGSTAWTFDDLQALPDDPFWRYEIVDGGLVMTPSAGAHHEFVSAALRRLLQAQLPTPYWVIGPIAVDLHPSYRVPDLVVVSEDVLRAGRERDDKLRPDEIALAIEIVSPGSVTTDRVTKAAQYAAAGIPAYWRIETQPKVSLWAYQISPLGGVYAEVGRWGVGQTATLAEPFGLTIAIDELDFEGL